MYVHMYVLSICRKILSAEQDNAMLGERRTYIKATPETQNAGRVFCESWQ